MASEERHRQWHPSVALDDFVVSIKVNFVEIVGMTKTPKLVLFDVDTVKRAVGWGAYIEEVVNTLSTEWQCDMLTQALASNSRVDPHKLTISRLGQARRWVLCSMLGSPFLSYHQKPKALLAWIMMEYAGLPDNGASPRLPQYAANDTRCFSAFFIDATNVMRSCANTAAVSHGHSALLACMDRVDVPPCSGQPACGATRVSCFLASEAFASVTGSSGEPHVGGALRGDGEGSRPLSVYEISVATAQKRAYARNCCRLLLSKCTRSDGGRVDHRRGDGASSFIVEMVTLAQTDTTVMEVMCLMLLDPSVRRTTFTEGRHMNDGCIQEAPQATISRRQHGSMLSPPSSMLLEQVLAFRSDARLWSLDEWLLTEVSHNYFSFADAYLAHILDVLRELAQKELEGSKCSADNRMQYRLAALCSRSERLGGLCYTALQQSTLVQSV